MNPLEAKPRRGGKRARIATAISRALLGASLASLAALASAQSSPSPDVARDAFAVLRRHCAPCHAPGAEHEYALADALDRDKLVAEGKLRPGAPEASRIYTRMARGQMPPPEDVEAVPSKDELEAVKRWIAAGAPAEATAAIAATPRPPSTASSSTISRPAPARAPAATSSAPSAPSAFSASSATALAPALAHDLERIDERSRRYIRYLSLSHIAAEEPDSARAARDGLFKLLNSLTWSRTIHVPEPADAAGTVFRIDLRDLQWDEALWERLVDGYPYAVSEGSRDESFLLRETRTRVPALRADWFAARASRPPLYHDLLNLPATDRDLERLLQIDAARNIAQERVDRAGFNLSGVSANNRVIERHASPYGAYWKSYDFAASSGEANVFERPLGPGGPGGFRHAGGEAIFHLPNGLQGYLVTDDRGRRIDEAPIAIVSDPRRPDKAVVNGLSCMTCHADGTIPKRDAVRPTVERSPSAFGRDADRIAAIYPPADRMDALLEGDARRFREALAALDIDPSGGEPISRLVARYEAPLSAERAAAELGTTREELLARIPAYGREGRILAALAHESGSVRREVFEENFAPIVAAIRPGATIVYAGGVARGPAATPAAPRAIPSRARDGAPRGATTGAGSGDSISDFWGAR